MTELELINYSEFNTLTDCEQRWQYAYMLGEQEEGRRRGLHLGTLCHLWHSRWMLGLGATLPSEWTDDINTGGKPGEVRTLRLTDFEPELVERALWLAGRFMSHYGEAPPSSWNVISTEEWLRRDFEWGTLVGRTDGFVEIDGHLWLIEVKSYGSRPGPLAYAQVSPQLGCYSLLAEAWHGQIPYGILYQGIYTYQWKPTVPTQADLIGRAIAHQWRTPDGLSQIENLSKADQKAWAKSQQSNPWWWTERDPSESFDQLEVELGVDHLVTAQRYLRAAVERRTLLAHSPDSVLPSVGAHCRNCGFKDRCWNDLGGVEPFEIEVEDNDAEPV